MFYWDKGPKFTFQGFQKKDLWELFDRTVQDRFILLGCRTPIINSNSKRECCLNYVVVKNKSSSILAITSRLLDFLFFCDGFQKKSSGEYWSASVRSLDRDVCIVGVVNFDSCIKSLLGLSAGCLQGLDAEHTSAHTHTCTMTHSNEWSSTKVPSTTYNNLQNSKLSRLLA